MPTKKDPRNEVGAIVHTVANRALRDNTAKNIFGNVNYAKYFLQGTVVGVFDGCALGGKNAIWKLTIDFQMPSNDPGADVELKRVNIHRQHCIIGPNPVGKTHPAPASGGSHWRFLGTLPSQSKDHNPFLLQSTTRLARCNSWQLPGLIAIGGFLS
jgi:hypothetical protein